MDNTQYQDANTPEEGLIEQADPLKLDLSDYQLIRVANKRIKDSKAHFAKYKIAERQNRNLKYLLGEQIDESKLKEHNVRYMDNIIYEAEASIKPIALSRLPDLIVKQGNETPESKDAAEALTEIINSDIRKRDNRKILAIAFKHIPVYLTAVIKAVWNPEKGENGDFEFINVNPKNIIFDHSSKSNNPEDMDFIAEEIELSVKEVIMRFPKKEDEILSELGFSKTPDEAQLASKVKYYEIWFTWYDKKENEWERVEGVAWKMGNVILGKMKNPYWDWEGETNSFIYDIASQGKEEVGEEELRESMLYGSPSQYRVREETTYHNHFENPKKPYIILGYDQYNLGPYDATSRIEQNIFLQDNVNIEGRMITELARKAGGKNIWSKLGGMKKEDIEEMDMDDPDEDVLVDGEVNKVHAHIPGQQPTAALFQAQDINRDRIFSKMGVNATTRGSVETDTATTAQIARESDYGRIDDLTEDTINYAAEQMANWDMQFIKLFYTEEHMRRIVGKNGQTALQKVQRDLVEDGMEIEVYASGVDKVMRKREAYEKAKLKLIDPLTFFEDVDAPEPEERTKRLLMFLSNPPAYIAEYGMGLGGVKEQAELLTGQPAEQIMAGEPEQPQEMAMPGGESIDADIQTLIAGGQVQIPANIDNNYIGGLNAFIQSPEFQQLAPESQGAIAQYAQEIVQQIQGSQNPAPQMS